MKVVKILTVVIIITLIAVGFMACNKEVKAEGEYTIVSPAGAPSLALAKLVDNASITDSLKVTPSIVSSDLIRAEALKSDFAIVPANMAAIISNGGYEYNLVGTITVGNMYIVAKETETFTLDNLKGKMLYSIGQGSIPALIMQSVLTANNIEYEVSETPVEGKVAIKYLANPVLVKNSLAASEGQAYGYIAEPQVTQFVNANAVYMLADMQDLWKQATNSEIKGYAQAVLIAKKSICDEKPEVVDAVIEKISNDIKQVYSNPADAITSVNSIYENCFPTGLDGIVLYHCNIKFLRASENVDFIYNTLKAAYDINPTSVGGQVPAKDSGFYY